MEEKHPLVILALLPVWLSLLVGIELSEEYSKLAGAFGGILIGVAEVVPFFILHRTAALAVLVWELLALAYVLST